MCREGRWLKGAAVDEREAAPKKRVFRFALNSLFLGGTAKIISLFRLYLLHERTS